MEQFKDIDVVATKQLLTFMDASKNLTLLVGRSDDCIIELKADLILT